LNAEPLPPARRRILRNLFLGFCVFGGIALALLGWYVSTDSFQQRMRGRLIAELEKATGGKVELGELHTIPFRLRVEGRNLTIHGREAAGEPPFLRVDRVQAELKVISLLSADIGLHSLLLEHPVVHIVDYPDGTTNAPAPAVRYSAAKGPVERLFSLSVRRIEVQNGELLWQDQKVPFEFAARDVALLLNYSLLRQRYEAHASAGAVDTHWQQNPGFVWSGDTSLVLARGRADIAGLTVKSAKSEFHFAGQLLDFHDPKISGEYHGVVDLTELVPFLRQPQLHKGSAQFSGKGTWSLRDFSTDGTLQAKDVDWSDRKLQLRNGRAETAFSVTPARLRLTSIKANLMGGDLAGDVDVTNWQNSLESSSAARPRPLGRMAPGSMQRGSAHFQVARFPLAPVLTILSTDRIPLDRLNLAVNSSGTVELLWVGSVRDAETRLNLSLAPPPQTLPSQVPLRGQVEGVYRGSHDELDLSALHLATNASDITAAGSLSAASSLHFTATSHNVREWAPLLEALYGSPNLPFVVHGWASLTGTASGRVSALTLNGNLEAYDFETTIPAQVSTKAQTIHWDALASAIQVSDNVFAAHNGSLIHGHTVAHFDASSGLTRGELEPNSPVTAHLDVLDADVAEVAALAGVVRPLTGKLGVSLNLSGTRNNPHGEGHFEVRDGVAYGVSVPVFHGDLQLAGNEMKLTNFEARAYNATLSARASANRASRAIDIDAEGHNLDLARFPRLESSRLTVGGVADFKTHITGTMDAPSMEVHAHVTNLAMDKEHVGDFYVGATTAGHKLELKGRSAFDQGVLNIHGTVDLEKNYPADVTADFQRLNIVSLLSAWLPGKITGATPADGTIELRGPLRSPRDLMASAHIQSFSAEVEHVQVASVEPIHLELINQTALVEKLHLAGSGTDFTAHGSAQLTGAQAIDLQLEGTVNMTLLESLNPKVLARGSVNVNLTATGSLAQPVLQGRLSVKNTAISHNDFPSGLSDLNGELLFDRNRIQIQSLNGTTGGGTIALNGMASYQGGQFLLDLGATAHGVRLRYPAGVSSTANADLRLTGTSNSALLSGDVTVTKLAVTPGFDFAAYMENSKRSVVFTQSDSLESRLRLDVHVTTTPELQMQTAVARLSGNADLRMRGTAERPVILGRTEVLEGDISFNGTKYHLERGDVTFANPAKTQPVVDLQATTRVRDYDITIRIRGDASAPNGLKATWQSEPSLPENDVIALLALGRTQEEAAAAQQSGNSLAFGGEASNLLINEALNSTVNSRLQKLFGASRIKIDPQGLATETNIVHGPQLTIEQQVASNITLTYSTNVSVSSQQIIQAEYNITRNISIVALRDQNGVVSFDLRIRTHRK